jgi:hypothetical protein
VALPRPDESADTLGVDAAADPIADAGGASHANQVGADRRQARHLLGAE